MFDFILAPFLSLFSPPFYRRLLTRPQSLGFLYLAYLSFLVSTGAGLLFRNNSLPAADELVDWLGRRIPEIVFTREGVRMGIKEPLLLSHPRWGALLYLDPTHEVPKSEDLEKALVVLAQKKAAYHDPNTGESRLRSLIPNQTQKEWKDLTVTGEGVLRFWRRIQPWVFLVFFGITFMGFYLWKLLAGLVYSLIALLLNRFRTERLRYPSLLNLTFFALTPVVGLQFLSWNFPRWPIPLNPITAFLITSLYLALAILWTQEGPPRPE